MLNAEPMAKFVAALRSGDFQQAKGTLCRLKKPDYILEVEGTSDEALYVDDNEYTLGHCCLGVASEVAVNEGIISKKNMVSDDGETNVIFGTDFDGDHEVASYTFLPEQVKEWLGLPEADPRFDLTGTEYEDRLEGNLSSWDARYREQGGKLILSASTLNDRYGFTFEDIANLFESGVILNGANKPVARA